MEFLSHSALETQRFASEFAKKLKSGDTVAFYGELGAGKTQFTAGAAHALGYSGSVTSPTYTILLLYGAKIPVAHFDMYRIETERQLENTGFFDYAGGPYITFIEWAENIEPFLPARRYSVHIEYAGENDRKITIEEPQ